MSSALHSLRRILVTGANGFVGRGVCRELLSQGARLTAAVRKPADFDFSAPDFRQVVVGNIDRNTVWDHALADVDIIFHLAARTYGTADVDLRAYREVNVDGTEQLAHAAARAGVRRFVFLSSVKVNGDASGSRPFSETDMPRPQDAYADSKWRAEQILWEAVQGTGMEAVVLRSPLVYGPGVKANFLRLLNWVDRGVPLPFADVDNRRSLIYLGNLIDAMIACSIHPAAAGKTYLLNDSEDLALPGLIRMIAAEMGKPPRLWNCPESLLRAVAFFTGRSAEAGRLLNSLQLDGALIRDELGWQPPVRSQQGMKRTAEWFLKGR